MSKIKMFLITAALVLTASLLARAEDAKAPEVAKDRGMMSGHEHGMMEHGAMKAKPCEGMADCPLHTKMMHSTAMMVATNDGGVVVLADGKLTKYDKNLAVVKVVDLQSEKTGGCGCPKCEKKKIMMKTRDLNETGKTAPAPVKK